MTEEHLKQALQHIQKAQKLMEQAHITAPEGEDRNLKVRNELSKLAYTIDSILWYESPVSRPRRRKDEPKD